MVDVIHFERDFETAGFYSPLVGMEFAEDRVEVRTDPLTGMTAVASAGLEAKEEMFLGKTDWDVRRGAGRTNPRGLLLLPGEGARGHP